MNRLLLVAIVAAVYALHQDIWFWHDARPLVFGFLPIGLAYHGLYCLTVVALMWWLTRVAWPSHLETADVAAARAGETPTSSTRDNGR